MSTCKTWAIIPVKALSRAKQRLSPVLPDDARRTLVLTMLEDVLASVRAVAEIDTIIVVTPDADVAALAEAAGTSILRERRARGLNAAVRTGLAHAAARGVAAALVLPADVPLATPHELRQLAGTATAPPTRARATLVPSADGEGTNALLLAPPGALEPCFGEGSFLTHLSQAVARRLDTQVLQLVGLAADIDQPRHLAQLLAASSSAT
jgi:2-phospho-L-lactate/phosphoenolpyruvate guanylyltransferase